MCRLERRCSFHGCTAPVFPTPRCGIPALPQPFLSAVPSWDCRGSSKTRPWSYPSRRSCEATVACVRVLFSRVRCTRSGWGLRSPSVPQMIGFLGKMPAAVSVQSFPSRGASAARRAGSVTDSTWLILPVVICLSQRLSHACVIKKLVVGPWVGPIGPPSVCTGRLVPSASDALLALTGRVVSLALRTTAKAFAKDVFINQERKLGVRRRSDTVLVSTINDADQGSADVAFRTPLAPYEKSKSLGSGGSMVARLKLKGIDGRAPPGVEPAA
ncbi:hypothetical protein HN873_032761 [Arachis hypogaea]